MDKFRLRRFVEKLDAMGEVENDAPLYFSELMTALGSRDGREITVQLDELRAKGKLMRDCDGRYLIGEAPKGKTGLFGPQHKDPNV